MAWEEQGEGQKETKNINDFSSEGNEDSQVEMELACPHPETNDFYAHQERTPEVGGFFSLPAHLCPGN